MDAGLMGTLSKWLCLLMLCASTAALAQPDSGQRRKHDAASLAGEWRWVGKDVPELILVLGTDSRGELKAESLYTYRDTDFSDPKLVFNGTSLWIRKDLDENAYLELDLRPEGGDLTGRCLMVGVWTREFDDTVTLRRNYFEYAPAREAFRFLAWPGRTDGDDTCTGIVVYGYAGQEDAPALTCEFDLVEPVSVDEALETDWVDDRRDINFDGVPDLEIYLGNDPVTYADHSAAYVWNPGGYFEAVEGYAELENPFPDPDTRTVSSTFYSGDREMTTRTYVWQGSRLVLMREDVVKMPE